MKRIVASVGLVAVGASGLQAALLPALTTESGKPWNLSSTLRGFYDDNVNSISKETADFYKSTTPGFHEDSLGFESSTSVQFSFPMEQTTLGFGYTYSLKYYENKPLNNTDNYDMTHDFNAALTHAFSERYQLSVRESFVIGQEPELLRAGNTYTTFQRVSGDNLRNYGSILFSAQLTPEFAVEAGYANTFYSYADDLVIQNPDGSISASNSGLMDELENAFHLDGRYQFQPQTIGIVGYQFRLVDYTGNQEIWRDPLTGQTVMSDERNAAMHYGYVGVDHNFRPDLTGSVRVGRYTDYYNDPTDQNDASPYALLSLRYTYRPESYLEAGFSYDYAPSSRMNLDSAGNITLNAQAATVYATLHHRITQKLYGSIIAQFQNSTYYGADYDGRADNYFLLGLSLRYAFTPNFSAEVGYNYDNLNSGILNSYDRNRVYIGVTGSY